MNKLKTLFLILTFVPFLSFAPVLADSNPLNAACETNDLTRASAVCQQSQSQGTTDPISGPNGIISVAANIIASITGIGAVIMIVLGAFALATSGGNAEATKKARQRITGALIGLVVVALAWALVRLITDRVIG